MDQAERQQDTLDTMNAPREMVPSGSIVSWTSLTKLQSLCHPLLTIKIWCLVFNLIMKVVLLICQIYIDSSINFLSILFWNISASFFLLQLKIISDLPKSQKALTEANKNISWGTGGYMFYRSYSYTSFSSHKTFAQKWLHKSPHFHTLRKHWKKCWKHCSVPTAILNF